jgi:hypothetical protein
MFQHENDGLYQTPSRPIFPPSHTLPMSARSLSISFSAVKVCSREHALRDAYLMVSTEHASNPYITTYVARLWEVVGKQNAPTNPKTPYDPFSSSQSPLFHSFRRRSLSPVFDPFCRGGASCKAESHLHGHIQGSLRPTHRT